MQNQAALAGKTMQFSFGDCCLDVERRELTRRAKHVTVEPQVFDLLLFLIQNRDRVVTKDNLLQAVWRGRIVSEATVASRIKAARAAIGDNGGAQHLIKTLARKGFRFLGDVAAVNAIAGAERERGSNVEHKPIRAGQSTNFCRTKDGINLAFACVGSGPVVVRPAYWATNIDYDLDSPVTGPILHQLMLRHRVVRYDGRGSGLSDRTVPDLSFATMVEDLETVIEANALKRVTLLGISGGAATAIAYTVRHPERVSKLILFGGYARGRNKRASPQDADEAKAFLTMLRSGWGNENSVFMRAFCSFFLPGASPEITKSFVDFQRLSTTGENAVRLRSAVGDIDIADLLPKLRKPTLVFHCVHDNLVPFDQGRRLAAGIRGARFVSLDSANHALLATEPAWMKFVEETETFLAR